VINAFADESTQRFWDTGKSKGMPPANLRKVAIRKLPMLDAAITLDDLRAPPANRLEQLVGDRRGQYSIRINDQFRICFEWRDGDVFEVEITDYH
jgi:toxin HigB-1